MKKRVTLLIALLLTSISYIYAQQLTITGTVIDKSLGSNTLLSLFLTRYSEIKSALIKLFFETPLASVIRILEVSSPSFLQ